jgi:hypothetical protein
MTMLASAALSANELRDARAGLPTIGVISVLAGLANAAPSALGR